MKYLCAVCLVLALAASAAAQSVVIDSYTLKTYNAGAPNPIQSAILPVANVVCNQVTVTPQPGTFKLAWDDPNAAGRSCAWTDPGTGPLMSTPIPGSYEATLTATNSGGSSPESARAPFARVLPAPSAPTGLHVVQ